MWRVRAQMGPRTLEMVGKTRVEGNLKSDIFQTKGRVCKL